MKKITTEYVLLDNDNWSVYVTVDEQEKRISLHSLGEPCNGILRHWGTKEELIIELNAIVESLKKMKI